MDKEGFLRWCSGIESAPMQELQEMKVQSRGREDSLEEGMQPTPVFLPGESHGQRNLEGHGHGVAETWTRLSTQGYTWTAVNKQELKAVDNLPKSARLRSSTFNSSRHASHFLERAML